MNCPHPNPQFARYGIVMLNGKWSCQFDPGKSGAERQFEKSQGFDTPSMCLTAPKANFPASATQTSLNVCGITVHSLPPLNGQGKSFFFTLAALIISAAFLSTVKRQEPTPAEPPPLPLT